MSGRIFVPERRKGAGGWRKMYSEEIKILCSSPFNIRVVKSGRMRRTEHATRREEKKTTYKI
jgi:hypothetical protein